MVGPAGTLIWAKGLGPFLRIFLPSRSSWQAPPACLAAACNPGQLSPLGSRVRQTLLPSN